MDRRLFHDLFDAGFYQARYHPPHPGGLEHFVSQGDAAGFDPGPYFSTSFYKARYPDWQTLGARTAVEDFLLRIDRGETRVPHPLIDPDDYRARYPDLSAIGAEIVLHFVRHGDAEGRRPSAGFDAAFYARCYLPLEARFPFRHFVTTGQAVGHLPRPFPQSAPRSRAKIGELTAGMTTPLVMGVHDAQAAGAPILTLDLARVAVLRGWQPVFVLHRAGPLIADFRSLGPTLILAEGWDATALAKALPARIPALINSAAAADIAATLAQGGRRCLLLVHEMPDYLRDQHLMPDVSVARDAGAVLIASAPRMASAFATEVGRMPVIRPGIALPPTPLRAFRTARRAMAGRSAVFISAGHADRRKGFDLFITAAEDIARRLPGAGFIWLGALDNWARGLADGAIGRGLDLVLPGFVADAPAWYRAADTYLLTSRQDAGPATVIHAARMGTPFVGYAADIGLIGQAEPAGRFIPPGDSAAFVDAAIDSARNVTAASRQALRRNVAAATSFPAYVDAVLSRLTDPPATG